MNPYIIFFMSIAITVFLLMVMLHLLRIEKIYRDMYLYTERKVKIFIEREDKVDFSGFL